MRLGRLRAAARLARCRHPRPDNRDYHCVEEDDRRAILEDRDEYISENVFWVPEAVLDRYEHRQLTSGEVIQKLVELAKQMRDARRRHEALGLTPEEVAFYDALAGSSDDITADAELADIARDLVKNIKADLTIDWADHEFTEAAIRAKIKRRLRRHGYTAPKCGAGHGHRSPKAAADLILDQARNLYRMWPDVWQGELIL